MDGLFADLTNSYCNTNLFLSTSLLLCFESTPPQDYDGCYNDGGNEHFYLRPYNEDDSSTWLGVKKINPSLNGTLISIFCILTDDNCLQTSPIETNIFNYLLAINGNDPKYLFVLLMNYALVFLQYVITAANMPHVRMEGVYVRRASQEME